MPRRVPIQWPRAQRKWCQKVENRQVEGPSMNGQRKREEKIREWKWTGKEGLNAPKSDIMDIKYGLNVLHVNKIILVMSKSK